MIVGHADGLHERVADRRSDESKAALAKVFAHRFGDGRRRRKIFGIAASAYDRFTLGESPDERVEGAELALDLEKRFGIGNGGFYLGAIAYDAGVEQKLFNARGPHSRNPLRIEVEEQPAVVGSFVE